MIAKLKREILISIVPALILATCQAIGYYYTREEVVSIKNPFFYIAIVVLTLLLIVVLVALNRLIVLLSDKISSNYKLLNVIDKRVFWVFLLALILLWLPAFLALWPGQLTYDAPGRLDQFYHLNELSAHFPVLHTLLMIGCIDLCNVIGIGFAGGITLYSVIQGIIVALCIAYTLAYIWKKMNLRWLSLICLLLVGANPVIQMLVFTATHDIIFGGVLLVMTVLMIDSAVYSEEFFQSKFKMVSLSIMAFLMCMFRNQGIYMLILLLPFAVIAWKRYRIKMLLLLLVPIIVTKVVTGPIYDVADIGEVNPREALSMPIQQIGYVASNHPERITDDEYEVVYRYIPEDYLKLYNREIADPVKSGFVSAEFAKKPFDFLKTWVKIGVHNPSSYVTAFAALNYGYYYMFDTAYYLEFLLLNDDSRPGMTVKTESKFLAYEKYLEDVAYDGNYKGIPMVSQALPFVLIIVCAYVSMVRRRYKQLALMVLPFGYFGTLLIGPVAGIRYVFPLLIMVPILLGIILNVKQGEE